MRRSSQPSLPDRERAALADLLEQLGPDAPTCCAGWTTAHMAAHLVARDRRPDTLIGLGLEGVGIGGPLPAWTHRVQDRLRESTPFPDLVAQLRAGPPVWAPLGLPGIGRVLNLAEYAIHHEDVRRAQPGWEPRELDPADQDALWRPAVFYARRAARRGGVVLRRSDRPGVEETVGGSARTVTGEPMELLLWTAGRRDVARVEVS